MLMAMLYGAKDLRLERGDEPPVGDGQVKVRFGAGGICGSDLSYYGKGRVGDFAVMQPLCLGHEVSGEVVEVGAGVTRVKKGDRVAINPNQPCRICRTCVAGKGHLCLKMNFYGSAAVFPHIQGVFREVIVASEAQCFPVPQSCDFRTAAMAEPLAVALHAVRRAGSLVGKSVLVTGVGPIGSLCVLAARRAGAARIVVTDVADGALKRAEALGIDDAVNAVSSPERVEAWYANKGTFDVTFECSGNAAAMTTAIQATASGGCVVQVGMIAGPTADIPVNRFVSREVDLLGAFRFDSEYGAAVHELATGGIDVSPLLTHTFKMTAANDAFAVAADRSQSMKVHLVFG
ncbi:MAG TPA: L-idonate 5-dehydrogenase [Casimicrobium huifangae]|jgi:L-idonate 5-dehydrogenase|nr:L-idonate 5-dehydrogenase [Casimicrobium huifangae]HQD65806.1 L-idonate 5-dehydrogenase [Casimicrobium huifangae]